ncbi:protein IWS1 homolog [Liolophura sinensis]|uniref:protein IWS1 homolog n=1 Tax=Liolophura sinensis TaxID=3198878 RepID=UPI0031590D46
MSSKRKRGTHKKVGECLDPKKRGRQRGKKPSSSADEEISAISATRSESDCTDDDFEDMKDHQKATRRLRTRQKRKFRMPSREEIWDKIPDTPSGRSTYSHLKPRKLVNNFTKENSRYNFDPDYTSGEDSIQDFVVPDDEVKSADSEVSESDDSRTTASSKNRENREKGETSDSSDASSVQSDGSSNQYGRRLKKTRLQRGPRNQVNNDDNCTDESMNGRDSGDSDSDGKNNNVQSESDGSSNQYGKNLRKRRQRKIRIKALESSSDSDSGSCQSSHPPEVQTDQQEADSISPDSHNVNNNTPDQPVQSVMFKALKNYIQSKQPQLQMTNVMNSPGSQASSKNESIVDERMSDSEGENCRESSDSSGGNQESRRRRSKRQAARDLFADFKMTRAHRKKPK